MWIDKGLYWAWQGNQIGFCQPPTEKRVYRKPSGEAEFVATYTEIGRAINSLRGK